MSQIYSDVYNKSIEVQEVINNVLIKKFCELHNIPLETNVLSMKMEYIAKAIYFLGVKKKYAAKIFKNENETEIDIKGLVPKRSDYPILTRTKIMELLELILDDEVSITKIDEFDKKTEQEMRELAAIGDKRVGRPVTYFKSFNTYSKVPVHVLGMELWNQLEYKVFYPSSKGYMFRIKGVNLMSDALENKFKKAQIDPKLLANNYIVIPESEDRVPDYFVVDVDNIVKFAWCDRVEEILQPFGGRYNSRKSIAEESSNLSDLFSDMFFSNK